MRLLEQTKQLLRTAFRSVGWDVSRATAFGKNPFVDIANLAAAPPRVAFDVGANEGQTADELRRLFPSATLFCFEPYAPAFQALQRRLGGDVHIHMEHLALGDRTGEATLYENTQSVTNSLLPNAPEAHASQPNSYARPTGESTVAISTIDHFCVERAISHIDLLKVDSQGYDLRILTGASRLLGDHRVDFIVTEMLFAPLYSGQANFHEIYHFLTGLSYRLVGLYAVQRSPAGVILWCDALFRCDRT